MTSEHATQSAGRERRHFMRHPTAMRIMCRPLGRSNARQGDLKDVSFGGLSFITDTQLVTEDRVEVSFLVKLTRAYFDGVVVWCQDLGDAQAGKHAYGVKFLDAEAFRRTRLLEQICHIEAYRKKQAQRGRPLSSNQAAAEWIARYASRFPDLVRKESNHATCTGG